MYNLELFAHRVKKLRRQKKLSQQELGEVLGINQGAISAIESGRRTTTVEKLILLAKFFEVSTDYLLGAKFFKYSLSLSPHQINQFLLGKMDTETDSCHFFY